MKKFECTGCGDENDPCIFLITDKTRIEPKTCPVDFSSCEWVRRD